MNEYSRIAEPRCSRPRDSEKPSGRTKALFAPATEVPVRTRRSNQCRSPLEHLVYEVRNPQHGLASLGRTQRGCTNGITSREASLRASRQSCFLELDTQDSQSLSAISLSGSQPPKNIIGHATAPLPADICVSDTISPFFAAAIGRFPFFRRDWFFFSHSIPQGAPCTLRF